MARGWAAHYLQGRLLTSTVQYKHLYVLPEEIRAACGLVSAEAGLGSYEKKTQSEFK